MRTNDISHMNEVRITKAEIWRTAEALSKLDAVKERAFFSGWIWPIQTFHYPTPFVLNQRKRLIRSCYRSIVGVAKPSKSQNRNCRSLPLCLRSHIGGKSQIS